MASFESKKLSQAVETIQEFILTSSFPMPKNTVCMISAKGGVGKTNLSLMITSQYINNHDGKVCLWLTEDEEGNVKYRINTLLTHKIIDDFNQDRVELITEDATHFTKIKDKEFISDKDKFNDLKEFCILNDIRLLILDPLLAFFSGNENDNGHARTFMQPFINWCKECDITIVLIHHSSKGEGTNTRGAGAFSDAVRCAYTVSMPLTTNEKNHIVEDKYKSARGIRSVLCSKDNRGVIGHIYEVHNSNPFDIKLVPSLEDKFLSLIDGVNISGIMNSSKIKCETIEYKDEDEKIEVQRVC